MAGAALLLTAALVALARAQRAGARVWPGWLLLAGSIGWASAAWGWRGLMAWLGLVPLAAAVAMLARGGPPRALSRGRR